MDVAELAVASLRTPLGIKLSRAQVDGWISWDRFATEKERDERMTAERKSKQTR